MPFPGEGDDPELPSGVPPPLEDESVPVLSFPPPLAPDPCEFPPDSLGALGSGIDTLVVPFDMSPEVPPELGIVSSSVLGGRATDTELSLPGTPPDTEASESAFPDAELCEASKGWIDADAEPVEAGDEVSPISKSNADETEAEAEAAAVGDLDKLDGALLAATAPGSSDS